MSQLGFIFDSVKCVGCHACAVACKQELNTPLGVLYRRVIYKESGTFSGSGASALKRAFTTMACFHCVTPVCVEACPTGAMAKEATFGTVQIDSARCVGCRRCAAACPYGAPQYNRETRRMEKCTGCAHRVIDSSGGTPVRRPGLRPACVVGCPALALGFDIKAACGGGTAPTSFYDRGRTAPAVDFE